MVISVCTGCGKAMTNKRILCYADFYWVVIAGGVFTIVVSFVLITSATTFYYVAVQGVAFVTPQTSLASVSNNYAFQFDNTFYVDVNYLSEGLYSCGDDSDDYSYCWNCVAPIVSKQMPNASSYPFWAACSLSSYRVSSCSEHLRLGLVNAPACLQTWLNPYVTSGIRYTADEISIFQSLAGVSEVNYGLPPTPIQIFIYWEDVWQAYKYSKNLFIGMIVAFDGSLVLFALIRRAFYACCQIDPCTFEKIN